MSNDQKITVEPLPFIKIDAICIDGIRVGSVAQRQFRAENGLPSWIAYAQNMSLGKYFETQAEAVDAFISAMYVEGLL